jgi:hypothetical protein
MKKKCTCTLTIVPIEPADDCPFHVVGEVNLLGIPAYLTPDLPLGIMLMKGEREILEINLLTGEIKKYPI